MSREPAPSQDWEVKVINQRPKTKKNANPQQVANHARQAGYEVETVRKFGSTNAQRGGPANAKKIEEETEEFKHDTVELDLRLKIQKARQAKGWTQKELAQRINEKSTVIGDYESGKAIPNNQIISKMERALGAQLRGGKKKKKPTN